MRKSFLRRVLPFKNDFFSRRSQNLELIYVSFAVREYTTLASALGQKK